MDALINILKLLKIYFAISKIDSKTIEAQSMMGKALIDGLEKAENLQKKYDEENKMFEDIMNGNNLSEYMEDESLKDMAKLIMQYKEE